MKRFIIIMGILVALTMAGLYAVLVRGFYLDLDRAAPEAVFRTEGKDILRQTEQGGWETFEIRGVDLATSVPDHFAMDFAPGYEDYTRWLELIGEMGANAVRVYTVLDADFYHALYDYNTTHDAPLYLLQGLQVSDSANYGAEDVYQRGFLDLLLENGVAAVDVIHGRRAILTGDVSGTGWYQWDVSPWTLGYLVGHEWDSGNIAYTNNSTTYAASYQGTYFETGPEASRFEAAMAQVMDRIVSYESSKYGQQRLASFINAPENDPFAYTQLYAARNLKYNQIDAENILPTQSLLSGYFASYRLQYFSEEFLEYLTPEQRWELRPILDNLDTSDLYNGYLSLLSRYHTMPVLAADYGFSTARAETYENEPALAEQEQGEALVRVWREATERQWAGVFISTWQDVWERRTWNTADAIYEERDPVWQDVQTEGQCYGLMEFWLWDDKRVCYVDGDPSEWGEADMVLETEQGAISMKYDEKYLYFYVERAGYAPGTDALYIPIDTNPKLGSTYCENYDLAFERACDFVICIDGTDNSRVVVQERYDRLWAMRADELARENPYDEIREADSPVFRAIELRVQRDGLVPVGQWLPAVTYETGLLRHGNGNPEAEEYDSLADYCYTENGVEIRIPWQLLNFSNPSEMMIHDDYYEHYGIENLHIDEMWVGFSFGEGNEYRIPMSSLELEGWGKTVTYHERLKESYYILQEYWAGLDG